MWLKLAAFLFCLINSSIGSPLNGLHNGDMDIEESKFKIVKSESGIMPLLVPTTYRLPNNSIPLSYDLTLTTDIDKGLFNFTGSVFIRIRIVEESPEIVLHYRQTTINVINLWAADRSAMFSPDLSYIQIPDYEFLVITLPDILLPNEEIVLEISYLAEHRADGGGFYRGSYNTSEGVQVWYAVTQFEIDDARHAMPCYDEPGIRAPINVTIKHGMAYTAVSNTDIESQTVDGDYFVTKFLPTPRIQTYLLAFLVSDFDYVNATNTRISQRIYARPELIANGNGDFAGTVVGPMLRGIEEHLGVDYPISKMDHVGLSVFNFGAMENIGLITYTENGLLYDPNTAIASQESRKMGITRLIAHEYVHQWFGNIVSPVWWTYVWLNEGFATLLQSHISSLVYPEYNFMNNFVSDIQRAFSVDILSSNSWAMNHYTEEPSRLWDKFGGIGYQKSGCVLRMFQETLTPATFAKGLNYYLTKMYMQAAIPDDLHEGLQRAYDEDYPENDLNINELMHSWEDRPGYPIIAVHKVNNNLMFTQRRYPDNAGEIYSVPITIATKSNPNFTRKTPTIWLKDAVDSFTQSELNFGGDDWIILNIQQVGYYRVDYDSSLWQAIIKQLIENHTVINPINRAVLQDEIYLAFTDSTLSRVTISDCIDILSYFGEEDEPNAWSKANTLLNMLNSRLLGTSRYGDFLEFLRNITTPHLSGIGYEPVDFEPSVTTSLRSSTKSWNCLALNDYCLTVERQKVTQFYNTGTSASFDYCHALKRLNDEIYLDIVDGVAINSSYPTRTSYLQNLGCSLTRANLMRFLTITLDSSNTLSEDERQSVFTDTLTKSVVALETTIEFFDENYAAISTIIPNSINNILQSMASLINTPENVDKLETLITKLTLNGITVDTSQIRSVYLNNLQWQNDNFEYIDEWFSMPEETTIEATQPTLPSTEPTTPEPTEATTEAPSDGANSIILSFGLLIACLILNLFKN